MITIDGHVWKVPCDITREAEISPSDISGMLLDKSYFNDVLGTYMRYDVTLAVPPTMHADYAELYETLTDPVDAHVFVMPHNDGTLQVTARVESVKDVLVYTAAKKQYWRGVSFAVIANHPSKTMTLGQVLERGRSPLPEYYMVPAGTTYVATDYGWDVTPIEDADEKRY